MSVSDLHDENGLKRNVFSCWWKQFSENGATVSARQQNSRSRKSDARIPALDANWREMIAEIMRGRMGRSSIAFAGQIQIQ